MEDGLAHRLAEKLLDRLIQKMRRSLKAGHTVSLRRFGTFTPYRKKATRIYHPVKQKVVKVKAKRHVKFAASRILKEALDGKPTKKKTAAKKKARKT